MRQLTPDFIAFCQLETFRGYVNWYWRVDFVHEMVNALSVYVTRARRQADTCFDSACVSDIERQTDRNIETGSNKKVENWILFMN